MKTVFTATLATLSLVATVEAAPLDPFTGFIGFGDSLSDKGRQPDRGEPYLGGRFSNGLTWMELVGAQFEGLGLPSYNLALGGATAGASNDNDAAYNFVDSITVRDPGDPDDIPLFNLGTFDRQITSFVNAGYDTLVGDNPLFSLLFGGNDFLQNAGSDPTFNPIDVATDIVNGVERISKLDPSFDEFLVLNLPDISATPGSAGLSALEKALLQGAVALFNFELEQQLDQLANDEGLHIEVFDLFTFNTGLAIEFEALGVNVDDTCLGDVLCTTIVDADDFFFVDAVHPNRLVQAEISSAVMSLIQPQLTAVPLPAGLPLALLGIGAFGLIRATRKSAA